MSQSNTRSGSIRVLAGEDLTDKAGYLVKMTHDGGVPEVMLPGDVAHYARYVVIEEAVDGALCSVAPLHGDRNVRLVRANASKKPSFWPFLARFLLTRRLFAYPGRPNRRNVSPNS